jgi:hypothetical protein
MRRLVIALIVLCVPLCALAADGKTIKGEVRNPSGKLLYKTYTKGNVTETRTPSGKLVTKSKTTGGKTEVQSPTGKLLLKTK